jgi:predicted ATPase
VVRELLGRITARQPLVMVLEDLHWADDTSLRLFSFIACRLRSHPVLLVGSAREEEVTGTSPLGRLLEELDRQPHAMRLAVPALSPAGRTSLSERPHAPTSNPTGWTGWSSRSGGSASAIPS